MNHRRNQSSWLPLGIAGLAILIAAFTFMPKSGNPEGVKDEVYATGLESPWGMAFLPDGRMLVTEKKGNVRIIDTAGNVSEPLAGVPDVCACGQGGMLDVQLHPNYAENGWIYLAYAEKKGGPKAKPNSWTAITRARLDGMKLVDKETVFSAPAEEFTNRGHHFGTRIIFDRDGYMYFAIGDRGVMEDAQKLEKSNGKIHRLYDDGRIPEDNPFVDVDGAVASIWSYGHRNPQGIAVNPADGSIWNVEHGPKGGDELNYVEKGLNYGWPEITYGINYNGDIISELKEKEGMEQPAHYWVPSIATCGMEFYTGNAFPDWNGDLFVASLKFGQIHRIEVEGKARKSEEVFYKTGGRVRDIQTGPDGYLYLAIEDSEGRIIRLMPNEN